MKYLLPLVLILGMAACTSAPANDADEAGRSKVIQVETNERGTVKFPRNVNITFHGNVGDVTLLDQSGDVDGDQGGGQSNQGSTTTTGSGATQTPTATGPEVKTDVTAQPK